MSIANALGSHFAVQEAFRKLDLAMDPFEHVLSHVSPAELTPDDKRALEWFLEVTLDFANLRARMGRLERRARELLGRPQQV